MRRALALTAALVSGLLGATLLPSVPATSAVPSLQVDTVVGGLAQPWDVQPLPDGSLLVTERDSRRLLRVVDGTARPVSYDSGSVWVARETGLMSLAVDPDFASNRRFYTCQGGFNARTSSKRDVRVVSRRLSADGTTATSPRVIFSGIPATSGLHGGCRLAIARDGRLLIGTGDAFIGRNPRSLTSPGGKVLRVDRVTGAPVKGNPYFGARNKVKRSVLTYGHRNVQGLTVRGGVAWAAEHGPDRDDEVNRLVRGGDYGWHPVPGYNQSRPMTDHRLPGTQRSAKWRSGRPTLAVSGATWIRGAQWGDLEGTLAVASLKSQRVTFMRFDSRERFVRSWQPEELQRFGRLRSLTQLGNGDLLVTTANANGDRVLRVRPST